MIYILAFFLLDTALALLIGGMIFFPSVVAPTVFATFDTDDGGRFLRRLFPRYYTYITLASILGLGAALILPHHHLPALVFTVVFLSTLWTRNWLIPRLNRWRDLELAGDESAGVKFKKGHRISVLINLAQLVAIIAIQIYAR